MSDGQNVIAAIPATHTGYRLSDLPMNETFSRRPEPPITHCSNSFGAPVVFPVAAHQPQKGQAAARKLQVRGTESYV